MLRVEKKYILNGRNIAVSICGGRNCQTLRSLNSRPVPPGKGRFGVELFVAGLHSTDIRRTSEKVKSLLAQLFLICIVKGRSALAKDFRCFLANARGVMIDACL